MNRYQELKADYEGRQSEFQDDNFVILESGGSTLYGQYKQVLREMVGLEQNIKTLKIEEAKLIAEIETISGLERVEKFCRLESIQTTIKEQERAFYRFYRYADQMKTQLGDLDDARKYELESEVFYHKFKEMAAVDFVCHGRLRPETYRAICALPKKVRHFLLDECKNPERQQALINWFENRETDITPVLDYNHDLTKQLLGGIND